MSLDVDETACEYKAHIDSLVTTLKIEADALVGKAYHKERTAKGKEIAQMTAQPRYIDACRVAKGLPPAHGFFAPDLLGVDSATSNEEAGGGGDEKEGGAATTRYAAPPLCSLEEAARLAEEAEKALAELAPPPQQAPSKGVVVTSAEEADALISTWQKRVHKLEAEVLRETPANRTGDIDELESIAQEVVNYRQQLKDKFGYRHKDFVEDTALQKIEERLDVLAGALLPEEPPLDAEVALGEEVEDLRRWERSLAARLAKKGHLYQTHLPKPSQKTKELEQLRAEVAELKASLRTEGLTEHEQDKDERVLMRLIRIGELQQWGHHDKKHDKRERQELDAIREEIRLLRVKVEAHKRRLRDERSYNHNDIKHDPDVRELEERLSVLQKMGGA